MAFEFRGLEMHGHRMWERRHIITALEFIQAHRMTALAARRETALPRAGARSAACTRRSSGAASPRCSITSESQHVLNRVRRTTAHSPSTSRSRSARVATDAVGRLSK